MKFQPSGSGNCDGESDGESDGECVLPTPSAFEMAEANFLFQLEIIPLDTSALVRRVHEMCEGDGLVEHRKPELSRRFLIHRPFDQQPLFGNRLRRDAAIVRRTQQH